MNTWLKTAAITLARSAGFDLTPKWRTENLAFERFLRGLFGKYSIDGVIDVGANLGQYHDFVRYQVGFQGWIVSFEPDPGCVKTLMERARGDSRWHIEPVALGRQESHLDLHVTADSHFNSFLYSARDGEVADLYKEKSQVVRQEKVAVRKLDDYEPLFTKLGIGKPYLKLDTQGFDLEVLRGAAGYLRKVGALQTEASVRAIYDGMPDFRETMAFLVEIGFAWSHAFPVCHDAAMRMIEFDCVAVNSEFADRLVKSQSE